MAAWYCNYGNGSSTGYYAVAQWAALTSYNIGDIRRQLATPAVGSERCFRCTTAGVSGAAEPTWTLTKASTTADGTAVWTEVTGNSTYNWSAPFARLGNINGWAAAGDTIYIASAHAETVAAPNGMTSPGTTVSPLNIICVNAAGSVPPVSADITTGASITTTGANNLSLSGVNYIVGVSFVCGGSLSFTSSLYMENGNLGIAASNSFAPSSSTVVDLKDTTINLGSSGSSLASANGSYFHWWGASSAITGTGPNSLITSLNVGAKVLIEDVDLSLVASTKNLTSFATAIGASILFNRCKLTSGVVVQGTTMTGSLSAVVDLVSSDSSGTNYRYERYKTQGNLKTETTIVKTSPAGASDGTTALSYKIVTSSTNWFFSPFDCPDIIAWVDSAAAHTATIEVITDNVILTNADIWVEVEYLANASNPQASIATSRTTNILTAGSNLTTSSATWITTGLVTPKPQSIAVNFTTALKGPVRIKVKIAKVSTTVYVDPYPTIT